VSEKIHKRIPQAVNSSQKHVRILSGVRNGMLINGTKMSGFSINIRIVEYQ
jgi:hypothetical protein